MSAAERSGSIEGGGRQSTSLPGSYPVGGNAVTSRSPSDLDSQLSPRVQLPSGSEAPPSQLVAAPDCAWDDTDDAEILGWYSEEINRDCY